MALPERLTIDGKVWRVRVVRGLKKREGAVGLCERHRRLIRIDADLCADEARSTLVHELLHAAFPQGIVSDRTEERIIERLEEPVHRAFRVRR